MQKTSSIITKTQTGKEHSSFNKMKGCWLGLSQLA